MKSRELFHRLSCGFAATVFLFAGAVSAHAATISVTANATDTLNGSDSQCSLREAISNINAGATTWADCPPAGAYLSGDTINIPAGTYTSLIAGVSEDANATGDYDIGRSVSIVGAGSGSTTINGSGLDRVFHITATVTVSISGVNITGGFASGNNGAGIYNNTGALTVSSSTISGNTATWYGGGIHQSGGTVTVNNSTISGNAGYGGGGINQGGGTLGVSNSTISGNTVTDNGAGIYNWSTVTISNSTISGNTAPGYGGGIFNQSGGTVTLTDSAVSGNTSTGSAYNYGGGIFTNDAATTTITRSLISGNSATNNTLNGKGGGIFNGSGSATTIISNSTITGNTSDVGGGISGIGIITVTNATIVRNTAPAGMGGGYSPYSQQLSGTVTFTNSIVADNGVGTDCAWVIINNGGNIDSDGSCGTFTQNAAMVQGNGFDVLASNGGPTQTHALLAGSAAIDAAPTCAALSTDQRGTTRPQGSACDVGAYEYPSAFVATPTSIPTLSEWALIMLASLLGYLGFMNMRRKV